MLSASGSKVLRRLLVDRGLRNEILSPSTRASPAPLLTNGEDAAQSADKRVLPACRAPGERMLSASGSKVLRRLLVE
jgi:hypothetical protein